MKFQTTIYRFNFDKILWGSQTQLFLNFPGRYGLRRGPFKDREAAWADYVRVLRECFFLDDFEKEVVYNERTLVPEPYVPSVDFQI